MKVKRSSQTAATVGQKEMKQKRKPLSSTRLRQLIFDDCAKGDLVGITRHLAQLVERFEVSNDGGKQPCSEEEGNGRKETDEEEESIKTSTKSTFPTATTTVQDFLCDPSDGNPLLKVACAVGDANVEIVEFLLSLTTATTSSSLPLNASAVPSQSLGSPSSPSADVRSPQCHVFNPHRANAETGVTPLIVASQEGAEGVIRALFKKRRGCEGDDDDAKDQHDDQHHLSVIKMIEHADGDGDTALMTAALNGFPSIVSHLLDTAATAAAAALSSTSSLSLAHVRSAAAETVHRLLAQSNKNGITALAMAAQNRHADVVRTLLRYYDYNNDYNRSNPSCLTAADPLQADRDGDTPLTTACFYGDWECCELIIDHVVVKTEKKMEGGRRSVCELISTATNAIGATPIMIAAQNGHSHIIRNLVAKMIAQQEGGMSGRKMKRTKKKNESGNDTTNVNDDDDDDDDGSANPLRILQLMTRRDASPKGSTALMLAAANGHVDTVKCIIDCIVEVFMMMTHTKQPIAATTTNMIDFLLQHVNAQTRTEEGNTALILAARNGHTEVIEYLLQMPIVLAMAVVVSGKSKVSRKEEEEEEEEDGTSVFIAADPNIANTDGSTALTLAAEKGYADIVELLLAFKPSSSPSFSSSSSSSSSFGDHRPVDIFHTNANGSNALEMACQSGSFDTVKALCDHVLVNDDGDDDHLRISSANSSSTPFFNNVNKDGLTALEIAVQQPPTCDALAEAFVAMARMASSSSLSDEEEEGERINPSKMMQKKNKLQALGGKKEKKLQLKKKKVAGRKRPRLSHNDDDDDDDDERPVDRLASFVEQYNAETDEIYKIVSLVLNGARKERDAAAAALSSSSFTTSSSSSSPASLLATAVMCGNLSVTRLLMWNAMMIEAATATSGGGGGGLTRPDKALPCPSVILQKEEGNSKSKKSNNINTINPLSGGVTFLMLAAQSGSVAVCKQIVSWSIVAAATTTTAGADKKEKEGNPHHRSDHHSDRSSRYEALLSLIVLTVDDAGDSAFFIAAANGHADIVRFFVDLLVNANADDDSSTNDHDDTLTAKRSAIIRKLVNAKNKEGFSVATVVTQNEDEELAELLELDIANQNDSEAFD